MLSYDFASLALTCFGSMTRCFENQMLSLADAGQCLGYSPHLIIVQTSSLTPQHSRNSLSHNSKGRVILKSSSPMASLGAQSLKYMPRVCCELHCCPKCKREANHSKSKGSSQEPYTTPGFSPPQDQPVTSQPSSKAMVFSNQQFSSYRCESALEGQRGISVRQLPIPRHSMYPCPRVLHTILTELQ